MEQNFSFMYMYCVGVVGQLLWEGSGQPPSQSQPRKAKVINSVHSPWLR